MSGILPLTTTFKPPASCLTDLMRATPVGQTTAEDQLGPSPSAAECYPSGYKFDANFYFSPGLCPDGYMTVSSGTNQIGSLVETEANCCPTGFSWTDNGLFFTTCVSGYDAAEVSDRTVAFYSGTSSVSVGSHGGAGYAIASVVQVRYQAKDQTILTPQAPTTTVTVSASAAADGLTTGAKVGIGVGVPILVLLLVGIGIGVALVRQRRKRLEAAPENGTMLGHMKPMGEMDGEGRRELDGRGKPVAELG